VEIRARVQGFLQEIHFKDGDEVEKGTLLYEIDPRTFEADVARAEAEVARQQTQLRLATAEAKRASRIRATAVSEEEYEQKMAAQAVAEATVQQAKAALESARLQLSFTKIEAPISGRLSRTLVTKGNLVGFNQPTLLTTMVRLDPIYVFFDVPERNFLDYQRLIREEGAPTAAEGKAPVHVGLTNEKDYPHQGVIDFRDNRVDPATGTVLLRGELPNPDRLLTPGLFARVRVPVGKPKPHLLVPAIALNTDQRGSYLLIVKDDNTVEYRPVQTGATVGNQVVIADGLKPEDWVIVNGLQRARPGARVQPEKQAAEP
jgi:multidrug efflux system membrane fusion protein